MAHIYFRQAIAICSARAHLNATTSRDRRSLALSRSFFLLYRLLVGTDANFGACPEKELIMKLFGTVQSFDTTKGHGEIKPEVGADLIRFEKSAIAWDKNVPPTVGQRLSYEAGTNNNAPCALNLQTV